jgi:hypothetical protein
VATVLGHLTDITAFGGWSADLRAAPPPHRTAPHRTAPRRTAPRRWNMGPHRTGPAVHRVGRITGRQHQGVPLGWAPDPAMSARWQTLELPGDC